MIWMCLSINAPRGYTHHFQTYINTKQSLICCVMLIYQLCDCMLYIFMMLQAVMFAVNMTRSRDRCWCFTKICLNEHFPILANHSPVCIYLSYENEIRLDNSGFVRYMGSDG